MIDLKNTYQHLWTISVPSSMQIDRSNIKIYNDACLDGGVCGEWRAVCFRRQVANYQTLYWNHFCPAKSVETSHTFCFGS